MKLRWILLLLFTALGTPSAVYAQKYVYPVRDESTIRTAAQLTQCTPGPMTACDTLQALVSYYSTPTAASSFHIKNLQSYVRFFVDHNYPHMEQAYTYKILYQLKGYRDFTGTAVDQLQDTLLINYHPDSTQIYQDIHQKTYYGYYKLDIKIVAIYDYTGYYADLVAGATTPTPPVQVFPAANGVVPSLRQNWALEAGIRQQKIDEKVPSNTIGNGQLPAYQITMNGIRLWADPAVSSTTPLAQLPIQWGVLDGTNRSVLSPEGAQYELEWTYVDDYEVTIDGSSGAIQIGTKSGVNYDFRGNATRIRTNKTSYTIPLVYKRGWIAYRVRMLRPLIPSLGRTLYSEWSNPADYGTPATGSGFYRIETAHRSDSSNWAYEASYAEEGKSKQVLSYFDGLMKNRQSLTQFQSRPQEIIGLEKFYDYEGRPALQTLPVPVIGATGLTYLSSFARRSGDNQPYQAADFDALTPGALPALSATSQAASYYAPQNPLLGTPGNSHIKAIPNAQGYPLIQTRTEAYDPSRIRVQGGAGSAFQLGNGHETRYLYADPEQEELNPFFGAGIGLARHYEKVITKDPNNEMSFSILNNAGQPVMTGLMGFPDPTNGRTLLNLDGVPTPASNNVTSNIFYGNPPLWDRNTRNLHKSFINEVVGGTLKYGVSVPAFQACTSSALQLSVPFDVQVRYRSEGQSAFTVLSSQAMTPASTGINGKYAGLNLGDVRYSSGLLSLAGLQPGESELQYRLQYDPEVLDTAVRELLRQPQMYQPAGGCYRPKESFETDYTNNLPDCEEGSGALGLDYPSAYANGGDPGVLTECINYERILTTQLMPNSLYGRYRRTSGAGILAGMGNSIFRIVGWKSPTGIATSTIYPDATNIPDPLTTEPTQYPDLTNGGQILAPTDYTNATTDDEKIDVLVKYSYKPIYAFQAYLDQQNETCTTSYNGNQVSITKDSSADFLLEVYSMDVAHQLLKMHPEYCELQKKYCDQSGFIDAFKAIPNAQVARNRGLFSIVDISAKDPIYQVLQPQTGGSSQNQYSLLALKIRLGTQIIPPAQGSGNTIKKRIDLDYFAYVMTRAQTLSGLQQGDYLDKIFNGASNFTGSRLFFPKGTFFDYALITTPPNLQDSISALTPALQDTFFRKLQSTYVATRGFVLMQVKLPITCSQVGLTFVKEEERVFRDIIEDDEAIPNTNPNQTGTTLAEILNNTYPYNPNNPPGAIEELDDLRAYARQIVKSLLNCRTGSTAPYDHTKFVQLENDLFNFMSSNSSSSIAARTWKGGLSSDILKEKLLQRGFQLDDLCNPYVVDYKTGVAIQMETCPPSPDTTGCPIVNNAAIETSFLKHSFFHFADFRNYGMPLPSNPQAGQQGYLDSFYVLLRIQHPLEKAILNSGGYFPSVDTIVKAYWQFTGWNAQQQPILYFHPNPNPNPNIYLSVNAVKIGFYDSSMCYIQEDVSGNPATCDGSAFSNTNLTNAYTNYSSLALPGRAGLLREFECIQHTPFSSSNSYQTTLSTNCSYLLKENLLYNSVSSTGALSKIHITIAGINGAYLSSNFDNPDTNSKACMTACIACNEFKEAYEKYRVRVADEYSIKGSGHPNYEVSVRSFFNYYFRKEQNTSVDYLEFMRGCNLAEVVEMPLYKGYLQAHSNPTAIQNAVNTLTGYTSTSPAQAPFAQETDDQSFTYRNMTYLRYEDAAGTDHLYVDGRVLPSGSRLRPLVQQVPNFGSMATLNQTGDVTTSAPEVADLFIQDTTANATLVIPASMTIAGLSRVQTSVTLKEGGTNITNDPLVSRSFFRLRYTPDPSLSAAARAAAWGELMTAWQAWQQSAGMTNTRELFPQETYSNSHRNTEPEKIAYLNHVYGLPTTMPHDQVLHQLSAPVLQSTLYANSSKTAGYLHGVSTTNPNDPSGTLQLTLNTPPPPPAGWAFLDNLLNSAKFQQYGFSSIQASGFFHSTLPAPANVTHVQVYSNPSTLISNLHIPSATYQGTTYRLGPVRRIKGNVYIYPLDPLNPNGSIASGRKYHIYLRLPAYISREQSWEYGLDRIEPFPMGDNKRYFRARFKNPSTNPFLANDTFWAIGKTNFDLTNNLPQRYTDIMLCDNRDNEAIDSIDICYDRQINNALAQAESAWQQYQESLFQDIRSRYQTFITQSCRDTMLLTLGQMKYAVTLYNYDRAGNLMRTVPPMGVNPLTNTGAVNTWRDTRPPGVPAPAPQHTKATEYRYNAQNLKVYENTPDAGTTEYVYDQAGRLLLSQNSQQRTESKYSYNLYDKQNRLIETGQVYINPAPVMTAGQKPNKNTLTTTLIESLKANPTAQYGTFHNYILNAPREEVIRTTYDTALYVLEQTGNGLSNSENLRSRISSVATYPKLAAGQNGYAGYEVALHYSYDLSGNVKTLTYDMPQLAAQRQQYKRIDYDYDLYSGKVTLVSYNRSFGDQFYQRYRYDDDNRITATETSKDGVLWDLDAQYKYYPHGPLARISLGDQKVQGIDFAYTLQGWLKSINGDAPGATQDIGGDGTANSIYKPDLLKTTLHYFDGDYTAIDPTTYSGTANSKLLRVPAPDAASRSLYNGNIAAMTTAPGYFPALHSLFRYDKLNRLKEATHVFPDYSQTGDPLAGPPPPNITGDLDNAYRSSYTYDLDGNLQTLDRWGFNDHGQRQVAGGEVYQMDQLGYQYSAGTTLNNRLTNYTDAIASHRTASGNFSNDILGYNPTNAATIERLGYDAAGNLIKDGSNGLDSIKWNHYGKTTAIVKDNGMRLRFGYDPLGNRWKKTVITGTYPNEQHLSEYYIRDAAGNELATYRHQQRYGRQILSADLDPILSGNSSGGGIIRQVADEAGSFSGSLLARLGATDTGYLADRIAAVGVAEYARRSPGVRQALLDSMPYLAGALIGADTLLQQKLYPASAASLEPFGGLLSALAVDSTGRVVSVADSAARVHGAVTLMNDTALANRYVRQLGLDSATAYTAQQLGAYLADDLDGLIRRQGAPAGTSLLRSVVGNGATYQRAVGLLVADTTYTALNDYRQTLAQRVGEVDDSVLVERMSVAMGARLGSGSTGAALRGLVSEEALAGITYAADGAGFMNGLLSTTSGREQVTGALGELGLSGGLQVVNGLSGKGIDVRIVEPVLGQGLLEDKFYLADQVLYGSSRLGVKTYLPSQYQYHWNNEQTLAQNQARWDSSTAAYRMPWYSDAVQSLMHYNAPGPYTVAQSEPFWSSRIIGQKRYELTNHLGNVLGVVSDKVTEVAAPGSGKVERASLKAAYDYYPFGMVMPSRMVEDVSINCIPVSRTRYVREVVKQNQFSAGGVQSITGRGVALGGSEVVVQDDTRLEVKRGEGMADELPMEVAMPVGTLLGSDEVGVRLSVVVEGEGELVAQLRWYPGGWSGESGPVGAAYEVLGEAMVPDGGPLTVEAGNEDAPLPVQMRSNGGLALVLRSVNSGSGKLVAAEVQYETVIRAVQTYVVLSCDTDGVWGGGYQYGFNGQRKTDEISGSGNHNTATFWEYDTRLGRRWNLDPVDQISISNYSVNRLNPIFWSDPEGDYSRVGAWWRNVVNGGQGISYTKSTGEWGYSKAISGGVSYRDGRRERLARAAEEIQRGQEGLQRGLHDGSIIMMDDGKYYLNNGKPLDENVTFKERIKIITGDISLAAFANAPQLTVVRAPSAVVATEEAVLEGSSLRKVGSLLESVDDVMTNPNLIDGHSYAYVRNILGKSKGWVNSVMRKTRGTDKGWVLRQVNNKGQETGKLIQYHPGSRRHFGGNPYWKVSDGASTFRFPAAK
ncbi:MAG: hypothetical protein EOP52_05675 [Sphingobacteriales bacterium]|nr:MAG: hypothetical protein EOP52_05675 [Sphingobacteriales bacterium]